MVEQELFDVRQVGNVTKIEPMPLHNGTTSSVAAAQRVRRWCSGMRGRIYKYIASCGERGATREEIEEALGIKGSTVRPRVKELLGQTATFRTPRIRVADWKRFRGYNKAAVEVLEVI